MQNIIILVIRRLFQAFREYVLGELSVDGEAIYSLTRSPEYLLVARILLLDCREQLKSLQVQVKWISIVMIACKILVIFLRVKEFQ